MTVLLGGVAVMVIGLGLMAWALCSAAGQADRQRQQYEAERHLSDDWRRAHDVTRREW